MLRIMLQKLLHKKWLVVSLLIGNILLIAIAASYPMYKEASLQKMVTTEFDNYEEEHSVYPARLILGHTMDKESQVKDFWDMEAKSDNVCNELGLTMLDKITQYRVDSISVSPDLVRDGNKMNKSMDLYTMTDFKKHIKLLSGTEFSDTIGDDGCIEAVVSKTTFDSMNLLIGETFTSTNFTNRIGREIKVKVTGIYTIADEGDPYWVTAPSEISNGFVISHNAFMDTFLQDKTYHNVDVKGSWMMTFDYTKVEPSKVNTLIKKTEKRITGVSDEYRQFKKPIYLDILQQYKSKVKQTESILFILIIPLFVLLCAFIFMISSQMLNLEDNEISLFKSRGASKLQIFLLYLLQSAILGGISFVFALPLASLLCRVLGSANAFLEFVQRTSLRVEYSSSVFLYGLGAVVVSILITIIPVIKSSGVSIVNLKQKKARNQKKLWQKLYLDVILLAVSIYGYYTFNQQKDTMLLKVVTGDSMDPLLFLSSSIFILGAGLFAIRLQPLLVKFIYWVGRKRWKPANYASFLQVLRTGSKQYFIMVFMILTIALGIFNSTIARTIVLNAEKNIEYSAGADITLSERWSSNIGEVMKGGGEFLWVEPDYNRYQSLEQVESVAQVYCNDLVQVDSSEKMVTQLMGINTKAFGETAYLPEGLNNHMFNEYLNVLSTNAQAVLLSSNYMSKKGYKIGDVIELNNADDSIYAYNVQDDKLVQGIVYGFVDYWPGYKSTKVEVHEDGTSDIVDNYMVIANLGYIQQQWKIEPYQVWIRTKNHETSFFYDFIKDSDLKVKSMVDRKQTILNIDKDPMFQGTNGILTMSFIVILLLCCIGYLIYWILSIRNRELLFGVFRAMGMSKKEIIHMLINEQLFTGGLAIALGAGIGVLASRMFIPMIQIAYSGEDQALPLELLTRSSDMVRLFIIVSLVLAACLCVLANIINKLKIAQALKLGED